LPDEIEWLSALNYNDSIYNLFYEKCKSKYCKSCKEKYPMIHSNLDPSENSELTINVYSGCTGISGKSIYNLQGNVSEWTSLPNYNIGGGWKNSKEDILNNNTFFLDSTNAWTGFRNICEWKKWKIK
jgi:hypothetical protein